MYNRLDSIPACDGRTDRQTDRRTDRHLATAYSPRYAYASRGKNRRSTLPTELLTRRAVDVLMGMLACLANPTRQRNALRFLSPDHVLSTRGAVSIGHLIYVTESRIVLSCPKSGIIRSFIPRRDQPLRHVRIPIPPTAASCPQRRSGNGETPPDTPPCRSSSPKLYVT